MQIAHLHSRLIAGPGLAPTVVLAAALLLSACAAPHPASDSAHMDQALQQAMKQGWQGERCRAFEQTVTKDGKTETAYGTACRQADGTWKQVGELSPTPGAGETAKSFPYEGLPPGHYDYGWPGYRGYSPFFFGFGYGDSGGHIGYGVAY